MPKSAWGIVAGVVCLALGYGTYAWTRPDPKHRVTSREVPEITYVCTETKELTKGPWQPTPAVNPVTGRRTVMTAFYCPECKEVQPGPPVNRDRPPVWPTCAQHNIPLVRDLP